MTRQELQRRLLKDAMTFGSMAGALLLLAGIAFWLHGGLEEEKMQLDSQVNGLRSETASLQAQLVKAKESLELYSTINQRNQNAGFEINRDLAAQVLDRLKKSYHLGALSMKTDAVKIMEDSRFQKKTATILGTDVSMTFNGLTDAHLYSFIQAVRFGFPGYVRMSKLRLQRVSEPDRSVFLAISRGNVPGLVTADMEFKWYGIRYNTPPPVTGDGSGG